MSKNHKKDYDWLNDPFDEKKIEQERQSAHMSTGSKAGIGCGCLVAFALMIVVLLATLSSVAGLYGSL